MKKVPLRKCTGCGEMKPKRELIRVVKTAEKRDENGNVLVRSEISLDLTGKRYDLFRFHRSDLLQAVISQHGRIVIITFCNQTDRADHLQDLLSCSLCCISKHRTYLFLSFIGCRFCHSFPRA